MDVAASLSSETPSSPAAEATAIKKKVANVDFTEPLAPVVIQNESPNVTPTHKPPSPSKADKILALISEIGANQVSPKNIFESKKHLRKSPFFVDFEQYGRLSTLVLGAKSWKTYQHLIQQFCSERDIVFC